MSVKQKRMSKKTRMSWSKFNDFCESLALHIQLSGEYFSGVYGIPRGGLVVAVKLSHLLDLPLVDKVETDVLTVDDLTDSGQTLEKYANVLMCKTATLYHSKNSMYEPDFWVEWKPEGWVQFPWEFLEESTK